MNQDEQLKSIQEDLGSIKQKLEVDAKAAPVKTFNPVYATIIVAVIGFVGSTIATMINNRNSNALEARKFEFDIIKRGLEQPSQEERIKYLKFLSSLQLIKDKEINAALDSIVIDPEAIPNLFTGDVKVVPIGSKPLEFNKDITDSDPRLGALKAARNEVGHLEDTSLNNGGPYVAKYMKGGESFGWAAGFISWCYSQNLNHASPFKYSYSWEEMKQELMKHNWYFEGSNVSARPGDIYFLSNGGRILQGGIIDSVDGDIIRGIEGNANTDGGISGKGVYYKKRNLSAIKGFGKID